MEEDMGARREGRRMERGYEGWSGGGGGRIVRPGLLGPFHRRLQMFSWSSMARVRSLVVNDLICLEGKKKKKEEWGETSFHCFFFIIGVGFFPRFLVSTTGSFISPSFNCLAYLPTCKVRGLCL